MVTPDFEDWLARQEVPVEETYEIDRYQRYLAEEIGFQFPTGWVEPSPKQRAVIAKVWAEQFERFQPLGIRPVTYTYRVGLRAGQRETRWIVPGQPGLWSWEAAREWAELFLLTAP